ncbi:hypothetical protein [Agrobacterium rosae]|uniref:hypothetical protein n=1 Tax=Agrobacterium rosae TaxID=1972867 RepID=UPI000CD99403|nr:hypothetical protein [Agrobacterium rosae]POO56270.1 hypothetical protein CTT39_05920 [Agrobacterium rosae]
MADLKSIRRELETSRSNIYELIARVGVGKPNDYNNQTIPLGQLDEMEADGRWFLLSATGANFKPNVGSLVIEVNGQILTVPFRVVPYVAWPDVSHIADLEEASNALITGDQHHRACFIQLPDLQTAMLFKLGHGGQ